MATCDLTAGYSKPCRDNTGGIKYIQVVELTNVSTYTEASGEISAITLANGTRMWKWDLEPDLSNAQAVLTASRENGTIYSAQTVNITLNDNRKETRNQIMLLAKNDLFVIVAHVNGDFEAFGVDNGMTLATSTQDSGTAKADRNGNVIALTGMEKEQPYKVASGIIAGLLIPAS